MQSLIAMRLPNISDTTITDRTLLLFGRVSPENQPATFHFVLFTCPARRFHPFAKRALLCKIGRSFLWPAHLSLCRNLSNAGRPANYPSVPPRSRISTIFAMCWGSRIPPPPILPATLSRLKSTSPSSGAAKATRTCGSAAISHGSTRASTKTSPPPTRSLPTTGKIWKIRRCWWSATKTAFEVHTNFTGTQPRVYAFTLDDLLSPAPTANCALPPLEVLRAVFTEPELLRPERAAARVTEQAAAEFSSLATSLRDRGTDPERAAHFLMRLLFCLFADSIGLLPDHLFRQMIQQDRSTAQSFTRKLRQLFGAMSTSGNSFGVYDIAWFNGGLFADDEVFDLTSADMVALRKAAALDWSNVEPSIFGTLFERSLDPDKRSQLGAHYTSAEDILLIVEPVVMAPLRARWQQVKAEATATGGSLGESQGQRPTTSYATKCRRRSTHGCRNCLACAC